MEKHLLGRAQRGGNWKQGSGLRVGEMRDERVTDERAQMAQMPWHRQQEAGRAWKHAGKGMESPAAASLEPRLLDQEPGRASGPHPDDGPDALEGQDVGCQADVGCASGIRTQAVLWDGELPGCAMGCGGCRWMHWST